MRAEGTQSRGADKTDSSLKTVENALCPAAAQHWAPQRDETINRWAQNISKTFHSRLDFV